ncbi:MAG: hypothetical protein HY899_02215 [Deltaproteobacteria bacterium]|nr:hypothetical protein [Deltaproteobacteria bacterium]
MGAASRRLARDFAGEGPTLDYDAIVIGSGSGSGSGSGGLAGALALDCNSEEMLTATG